MALTVKLTDIAAGLFLRDAQVTDVVEHDGFRTIELSGDDFTSLQWVPGDKLRIRTDGLTLRTYTPISWDADRGATRFLAYVHGPGPGSEWCRNAALGDECMVRGPDRSVRIDKLTAAPIFVGDETSFGLLIALLGERPDIAPIAALLEVNDVDASRSTLHDHGVDATDLVVRAAADAHLDDLGQRVLAATRANPDAPVCLSGRAQTIASIRKRLKAEGAVARNTVVKAYWDVNRKGLD
jgi:NADPH-dependent ferric siderophore reductase